MSRRASALRRAVAQTTAPYRKGTLFCTECDYGSHVDDWGRDEAADETHVRCPDCGFVVLSQPSF